MKVSALVITLLLFLPCAFADINYTIEFDSSSFSFSGENGYDVVNYPGCGHYRVDFGAPQVLIKSLNFIIDANQSVDSIKTDSTVIDSFLTKYYLFPVQEPQYYIDPYDTSGYEWQDLDSSYFQTQSSYPDQDDIPVILQGAGFFDGSNRIITVGVLPVFWQLSDSTLYYYSYLSFTIYLSTTGYPGNDPIYVQQRMRDDHEAYRKLLINIVENPEDTSAYTPNQISDTSIAVTSGIRVYPYAIITRENNQGLWRPFIEWLNRKGKRAGTVTMEDILGYSGIDDIESDLSDDADALRNYLKYAYIHGAVWVLLGGSSISDIHVDIGDDDITIPIRYAKKNHFANPPGSFSCSGYDVPRNYDWSEADIYFSELNTQWERDGDGDPGETDKVSFSGDSLYYDLDHFQELFVGRLPAIDSTDIISWVNKILNYEQNPGNGDYDYLLKSFSSIADIWQSRGVDDIAQQHFTGNWAFHVAKEDTVNADPSMLIGDYIIDSLSVFPGFVSWNNHGWPRWICTATSGPNGASADCKLRSYIGDDLSCSDDTPSENICSIDSVWNVDKPGFGFSLCCDVSRFSCVYGTYENQSFTAEYVTNKNGGVGCIGATGATGTEPNPSCTPWAKFMFLDWVFNHDIAHDPWNIPDRHRETGPAVAYMKAIRGDAFDDAITLNLFGSPEQIIWNAIPSHFKVTVNYSTDSVTVKNKITGANIEGALVCFASKDYSKYYEMRTNANGRTGIPAWYDFNVTDTTHITVTKQNYIPYQILGSGDIGDYKIWRGDIAFNNDMVVSSSDTLIIKPGSNIYAGNGRKLTVWGTLIVEGDSSSYHTVFNSAANSGAGDWTGIVFKPGSQCELNYCEIKNAGIGIEMEGFIVDDSVVNVDAHIDHCSFSKCGLDGILDTRGKLWANSCSFENIGIYGIKTAYAETEIDSCEFNNCGRYAIQIAGEAQGSNDSTIITFCTIDRSAYQQPDSSQYAICIDYNDNIRLEGNNIRKYKQGGIKLYYSDSNTLNNKIHNGLYTGVYLYESKGLISGCDLDTIETGLKLDAGSEPIVRWCYFDSVGTGVSIVGDYQPMLGDETDSTKWGKNDFEHCYNYYIYQQAVHVPPPLIKAEMNYFGSQEPDKYKFYGNIDYDPYSREPFAKGTAGGIPIPYIYKLDNNYPNPFNPNTVIWYSLAEPGYTTIDIYNILGQKVISLINDYKRPGEYQVIWNGRNNHGSEVSSGVYFYRLRSGNFVDSKKMLLLR